MHSSNTPAAPSCDKTPLLAILVFTFANSIGTGLVTSGIYFITKAAYGFSEIQNLFLAVGLGLVYIVGAQAAGPTLRALRRRFPGFSARKFLASIMLLMAALCCIPPLLQLSGVPAQGTLGFIGIACLVLLYSPLSGALWPMVESYISGGRQDKELRSAIGTWNVVWSSALPVAYWGMSGFIATQTVLAFVMLVLMHLGSCITLIWFQREPASHLHGEQPPPPVIYRRLLAVLRLLLPMAYMVTSALGPILPELLRDLGVREAWRPVLGSAWLAPRALAFVVLQRWHGWHGTWLAPILGTTMILAGFAGAVLSPMLGESLTSILIFVISLAFFGTGMAIIYAAAIYYAMEVGNAQVDAGGTHEALIGVGYTVGPLCGLAGAGMVALDQIPTHYGRAAVVVLVAVIGVTVSLIAWQKARKTR
ncbi:MAG: hypothetical protein H7210_01865 [Pyrinomonadaceae bacterium]|nr:hypothetical protein [Phycisphaerales bacterium]